MPDERTLIQIYISPREKELLINQMRQDGWEHPEVGFETAIDMLVHWNINCGRRRTKWFKPDQ